MKKIIIFSILTIFILAGAYYYWRKAYSSVAGLEPFVLAEAAENQPRDRRQKVEISPNSTFGQLMAQAGIAPGLANEIYNTALAVYDLAKIKTGHNLELTFDKNSDKFKALVYKIDSEDELIVESTEDQPVAATSTAENSGAYRAEVRPIDYEVKIVTKEGEVITSMYQAALDNNIDERAIIELADAFQWSIDFALDPRSGDKFKFIYEERYLEGKYQMPGKILAGQYVNDGKTYQVYYFEEGQDNLGYFDENGNSVQKLFLKAPVAFKYISSGFTTGLRYIQAFDISTGHRAIDYAAVQGTPIRAVGDGTVIFAARNGAYGYMVKIRHNGTYQTNYGHLSKFAVRQGNKVKQGQVIGYVGSTGLSTGPHLHYEMVKNGAKINPLREVLPPGRAIKEENREKFFSAIKVWQDQLAE